MAEFKTINVLGQPIDVKDAYARKLLEEKLVNKVEVSLLGQVIPPANRWAQGMCVAEKDNTEYIISCFTSGSDVATETYVTIHNLRSGELIREKAGLALKHCNSATYCAENDHIYIATSGGGISGEVVELDWNLNIVSTHATTRANPWGVAWHDGVLYVNTSGFYIQRYNLEWELLGEVQLEYTVNSVFQGLEVDDKYYYLPNGNGVGNGVGEDLVPVQVIDVYFKNGAFCKKIPINIGFEVEEIAIYGGKAVINCNTYSRSLICSVNIFEDVPLQTSTSREHDYNIYWARNTINAYVDYDYKGFFIDGTESKPIPTIYWINPLWVYPVHEFVVNLLSDCPHEITIVYTRSKFRIVGNGHKCGGIYVFNAHRVLFDNLEITGKAISRNYMLDIENAQQIYLNKVVFSTFTTAIALVRNNGGNVTLADCIFNTKGTQYNLAAFDGGYYHVERLVDNGGGMPSVLNNPANFFDSASINQALLLDSTAQNMPQIGTWYLPAGFTLDLNTKLRPCKLQCPSGTVFANAPVLESGEVVNVVEVERLQASFLRITCYIYSSTPNHLVKVYRAYRNSNTNKLSTWKLIETIE